MLRSRARSVFALAAVLAFAAGSAHAGYVTFGSGCCDKWDDPTWGTPATVTWGYMPDGTTIDPSLYLAGETVGGSNITYLRSQFDAVYGTGAFDGAITRAMNTWHKVAGITFVGPVADPGLPMASAGATTPDIRIGAFFASTTGGFQYVGAVGFGPPGDDLHFPDPLAGDVAINLSSSFAIWPGPEGAPKTGFANDLEGLILHELGHAAMGLGHPSDGPPDVMYVGDGCCLVINREPSPDDIAGAQLVYGLSSIPACSNGLDDDGDGLYDMADPGCSSPTDTSEHSPTLPCDDGIDNDGDGRKDFDPATKANPAAGRGDLGCSSPLAPRENPQCQNGINDDGKPGTDFDGGVSVNGPGGADPNGADPQCAGKPYRDSEAASCGLGFEFAPVLVAVCRMRRRRLGAAG